MNNINYFKISIFCISLLLIFGIARIAHCQVNNPSIKMNIDPLSLGLTLMSSLDANDANAICEYYGFTTECKTLSNHKYYTRNSTDSICIYYGNNNDLFNFDTNIVVSLNSKLSKKEIIRLINNSGYSETSENKIPNAIQLIKKTPKGSISSKCIVKFDKPIHIQISNCK